MKRYKYLSGRARVFEAAMLSHWNDFRRTGDASHLQNIGYLQTMAGKIRQALLCMTVQAALTEETEN